MEIVAKTCSKCKKLRLLSMFGSDSRHKDRLKSRCKVCCAKDNRRYNKTKIVFIPDHQPLHKPTKKKCCKCGKTKSVWWFDKSDKSKDGLKARCKACRNDNGGIK